MRTREQVYAGEVYTRVEGYRSAQEEKLSATDLKQRQKELRAACKPYGSMAHKLPILIRTAGLAQALAFVEARGKDQHKELLKHLGETLQNARILAPNQNLVARSRSAEIEEYMRLTDEALAALLWFKRYAQSVLGVEATDDDEAGEVNDGAAEHA